MSLDETYTLLYYSFVLQENESKVHGFFYTSRPVPELPGPTTFLTVSYDRILHPGTLVVHNVQFVLTWKRVISSKLHHFLFFFVKLYFSMNL